MTENVWINLIWGISIPICLLILANAVKQPSFLEAVFGIRPGGEVPKWESKHD